jgi:hypothetical protein
LSIPVVLVLLSADPGETLCKKSKKIFSPPRIGRSMKVICCLTLTAIAALPLYCQSGALTKGERDRALSELHASRKQFLDSISGLTEAQWKFKPSPERWSIAECAEHITLSDGVLAGMIQDRIMKSPAEEGKRAESAKNDEKVLQGVEDRSQKFKAPEMLQPKAKWPNAEELMAAFKTARDKNIDYIRTTQDPLRDHFGPHPAFGKIDGYQWYLLLSGHSMRHTAQIMEVKADPNYPK